MNVLIIEDEKKSARELAHILADIDDTIQVIAVIESVEQALAWFEKNGEPDLIFSDIQLADGLCFDIFRQVRIGSPVIFCTAYDDYYVNAFDTNAISYLLKPITEEKVEQALHKLQQLKKVFDKKEPETVLEKLLMQLNPPYKTSLLAHQKEKIIPIPVKDISCISLEHTLVNIITSTGRKYYIPVSLDDLEKTLDPSTFYRANRQFIINRNAVLHVEHLFARKLAVRLHVHLAETIIISKAKAAGFLYWLENNS
jgi:two-component system LytT family response regulator